MWRLTNPLPILKSAGEAIDLGDTFTLGVGGQPVRDVYQNPGDIINSIIPVIFSIAGIILLITLIYAGFLFIKDDTKGKDEAKTIMTTALVGLIIMFSAYWIVQILSLVTGQASLLPQ
jgi:RsiW-degrading membrane proteinase PrsW (M82 family)